MNAEQAVARVFEYSVNSRASDLFFGAESDHLTISVRHLGILRKLGTVPMDLGKRFVAHIKAVSGMDVTERRRPLDGRWIFRCDDGRAVDLRINMVPTNHGEDLAIRLLDRTTQLLTPEQLGMEPRELDSLISMLNSPSGLILITGPTGSGKSGTIYACLQHLNDGQHKINTIEDPIEFGMAGVRQSQVNPAINLSFHHLLRAILRQSPDVIVIGEIRDTDTAQIAVQAANAGHLVLATVHATAAPSAVQSMRGLNVHAPFLASALRGVISQRLTRILCPGCKIPFDIADVPHVYDEIQQWLGPSDGKTLYAPAGCAACNGTGYAARGGVFEVMPISTALRKLVADGESSAVLRKKAVEEGMLEFRQSALLKVARGLTSTEEVFRVIPSEHMLEMEE
jgi:type II secretory ATPase GspE/PulE/Tfp pilus assembly ATPase PilB-like protein